MSSATSPKADTKSSPFAGERTIIELWASFGENTASNTMVGGLPRVLGTPIYFFFYVFRSFLAPFSAVRYLVTNRRIRVEKGFGKRVVNSVPLDDIEDIRLVNENNFTRTGDLEIVSKGAVALTLVGVQDPRPARQTMLDAVNARVQVQKVLEQQRLAKAAGAA